MTLSLSAETAAISVCMAHPMSVSQTVSQFVMSCITSFTVSFKPLCPQSEFLFDEVFPYRTDQLLFDRLELILIHGFTVAWYFEEYTYNCMDVGDASVLNEAYNLVYFA